MRRDQLLLWAAGQPNRKPISDNCAEEGEAKGWVLGAQDLRHPPLKPLTVIKELVIIELC